MNINHRCFFTLCLLFCLFFLSKPGFAQDNDIQISVCTVDNDGAVPLDGAVVVMQLGNQQPVGGTTRSDGCVDIIIEVPLSTSTEDITPIPRVFSVQPPYPNPFLNEVSIPVSIERTQSVSFEVFDITGRSVIQPYNVVLSAGQHRFTVETSSLKAGLYLYQLIGEQGAVSGKLVKVGSTSGGSGHTGVRVEAAQFDIDQEAPESRSISNSSNPFAVRIDAMRQGYLAARSNVEVTDGEEVLLEMEKVAPGVPSAPLLTLPGNGSVGVATGGNELIWNGDDIATSYSIQLSTSSDFTSVDFQQEGWSSESFILPELEPATLYFWRIRATGDLGTSEWSLVYQFLTVDETATPPSIPVLSAPLNGATDVPSTDVLLEWVTAEDAVNYRVQLATDRDFSVLLLDVDGVLGTSYSSVELFADTEYFWRVRANGQGGISDWSGVNRFTTVSADGLPGTPIPVSPSNGQINVSSGVLTLTWEAGTDATSYDYEMSTVPSFSTLVDQKLGVTGTSVESVSLGSNVTYYWHVRSVNENGTSNWSPLYSFTTGAGGGGGIPGVPVLTAPANGANGISPSGVNVTWTASVNATSYDVQLSTAANFSTVIEERTNVTSTSSLFNDIAPNTTHYWRVRASNAEGTSDWATGFSFTTGAPGSANEKIALDLMGPTDSYYGLPGGLVDNGTPAVTATNNKIVIIAISMSNGFQEFNRFIELYKNHPDVNTQIELVNCAVGGSALERWLSEDSLWEKCKDKVGNDINSVKVVWAKNANQFTEHGLTLPDPNADYYDLVDNIGALSQRIGAEFPSVQAIFHSSRIWGGYVTENKQAARGEPISYEGGYAINTVIEQYQQGLLNGSPWMGWGPYIWANGETPNGSGIFWTLNDFQDGGVNQHPSVFGATKVADALHDFFMQFDWYQR